CAGAFVPPPPETRLHRVSLFTGIAACAEGQLASNVVVAAMPARLVRHRIVRSRWTIVGLAVVAALAGVALLAPWLAPRDPYHGALPYGLRPPSAAYLFGTDSQGRDVLSRVLFGARLSLAVGLGSQAIALAVGLALGLAAGYYGRWADAVLMRIA